MIAVYMLAAIGVLLAVIAALIFKNKADNKAHEAEKQKIVADATTLKNDHRDALDKQLEELHEKHRTETIIERSQLNLRTDFDNDWTNGLLGSGQGSVAPDSGAAAAGEAGAAGNKIIRTDLSD